MQNHSILWAQNLPHSLSAPGHVSMSEGGHVKRLLACSLARSLARTIVPSLPPGSLLSSCMQQIRGNQRVSQLHPLSRAHLQPGDTTDLQTPFYCSRSSFAIGHGRQDGRKEANRRGSKASITTLHKRAKLFNGRQALHHISDDRHHIRANSDKLGLARCANLSTHRVKGISNENMNKWPLWFNLS